MLKFMRKWRRILSLAAWVKLSIYAFNIALLIAFVCIPQEATFEVAARTERLTLVIPKGSRPPAWKGLAFQLPPDEIPPNAKCKTGSLLFGDLLTSDLTIILTASAEGAMLDVAAGDGARLGALVCDSGEQVISQTAVALIKGPALGYVTLPFEGYLTLGSIPVEGSVRSDVLQQGELVVEARSFPFRSGVARSAVPLQLGEMVRIYDGSGADHSISHGVIRFRDGVALVQARARGQRAEVSSIGQQTGEAIAVAPTLFDKVRAQPQWAVIILITTMLLQMLTTASQLASRKAE
ncbi:MAG: hypothetical protein EOP50_04610 [Sphingobacteriales bacterium]|nr:MAG: hypothetical protein EOP50_04610 [Sphingobacteriales bacterium]